MYNLASEWASKQATKQPSVWESECEANKWVRVKKHIIREAERKKKKNPK